MHFCVCVSDSSCSTQFTPPEKCYIRTEHGLWVTGIAQLLGRSHPIAVARVRSPDVVSRFKFLLVLASEVFSPGSLVFSPHIKPTLPVPISTRPSKKKRKKERNSRTRCFSKLNSNFKNVNSIDVFYSYETCVHLRMPVL